MHVVITDQYSWTSLPRAIKRLWEVSRSSRGIIDEDVLRKEDLTLEELYAAIEVRCSADTIPPEYELSGNALTYTTVSGRNTYVLRRWENGRYDATWHTDSRKLSSVFAAIEHEDWYVSIEEPYDIRSLVDDDLGNALKTYNIAALALSSLEPERHSMLGKKPQIHLYYGYKSLRLDVSTISDRFPGPVNSAVHIAGCVAGEDYVPVTMDTVLERIQVILHPHHSFR